MTSLDIFELSTDLKTQNISRCSSTVKSLNNTSCCGQMPNTFLNFSNPFEDNILYESYIAFPFEEGYNPVNILIKVLFPAPLCPNKTNISFLYKLKDTPFKAFLPPSNVL